MIYLNIIMTIFLLSVFFFVWQNATTKKDVERFERERAEHNEYQKAINDKVMVLHEAMLSELIQIRKMIGETDDNI